MMVRRFLVVLAALGAGFSAAVAEPQGDVAELRQFFANLEGTWHCEGATSKGKETAATISFLADVTSSVFTYTHVGTKGHTNRMVGTWAYDKQLENLVVSRRYISPDGVYSDMFVGKTWTADSLILVARALWNDLWAENRFLYELSEDGKFKVTWEVLRDSVWKMGDYLVCSK